MPRSTAPPPLTFDEFLATLPPAGTTRQQGPTALFATDRHRRSATRLVEQLDPTIRTAAGNWPAVIAELTRYESTDWARVRKLGPSAIDALNPRPPTED